LTSSEGGGCAFDPCPRRAAYSALPVAAGAAGRGSRRGDDVGQAIAPDFARLKAQLEEIQTALRAARLDGWLLYDLHARNGVAGALLGHGDLTRRYFVYLPAQGVPTAVIHGIEESPWRHWPYERTTYVAWPELDDALKAVLAGSRRVAMEFSERDAVPAVDVVPAGVVELVRATGVQVVSSGDLLTRFCARWSADDLASHRRAAVVMAETAHAVFDRLAEAVDGGAGPCEAEVAEWVLDGMAARGCATGASCIVATGVNAADPHYAARDGGARFGKGDVVLLDLWGRESEVGVFADQTWMAYLGAAVPDRVARIFSIVRDARDAAVALLERAWAEGRTLQGAEVDDAARAIITDQGYGGFFIHRTGHSIDRAAHGMGPNIDNLETRETRLLVPGVGFSIEPGIYVPGEIGVRSEINVYIGAGGPEVTTPGPQTAMRTLLRR
jgi:Xaa-Pro dipeptidase